MSYVLQVSDLQARLGAWKVNQLLDDDNNGTPDTSTVAQIIADAESKVNGAILGPGAIYPLGLPAVIPDELKRLYLDAAVAYAAQRHPEVVRFDWVPLMDQLDKELDKLRTGKRTLGVIAVDAEGANNGAVVVEDTPDEDTGVRAEGLNIRRMFGDGMGDF